MEKLRPGIILVYALGVIVGFILGKIIKDDDD